MAGLYFETFKQGFTGGFKSLKLFLSIFLTLWFAGLIVLWWSLKTVYFQIKKAL